MALRQAVIEGTIMLDRPRRLEGATAEVRLREEAMADAPARLVAHGPVATAGGESGRLPFRLEATVEEDGDYALAAEVRLGGGAALAPGDLLTVVHQPWRCADAGPVTLPVREIS